MGFRTPLGGQVGWSEFEWTGLGATRLFSGSPDFSVGFNTRSDGAEAQKAEQHQDCRRGLGYLDRSRISSDLVEVFLRRPRDTLEQVLLLIPGFPMIYSAQYGLALARQILKVELAGWLGRRVPIADRSCGGQGQSNENE
jgi:hypothetical protein